MFRRAVLARCRKTNMGGFTKTEGGASGPTYTSKPYVFSATDPEPEPKFMTGLTQQQETPPPRQSASSQETVATQPNEKHGKVTWKVDTGRLLEAARKADLEATARRLERRLVKRVEEAVVREMHLFSERDPSTKKLFQEHLSEVKEAIRNAAREELHREVGQSDLHASLVAHCNERIDARFETLKYVIAGICVVLVFLVIANL